jgi:DNA-binding FadR family transcriptional regulator
LDTTRLSRRKLSDQVVDRIKHWLMAKNIKPGDRLPQEKELMDLFGVSRGTIREALKALEVQGLVSVATGRSGGAVVAEVSYQTAAGLLGNYFYFQKLQAAEIYDLRQLIEPEMAVSVVDRLTESDLKRLEKLIESCANVDDTPESRRRQRLEELEFHNVLAARSPNPLYSFTCRFINKVLADQVVFKRMYQERQLKIDRENHEAHSELLAAYRARDSVHVRRTMVRHMSECSCHVAELEAVVETRFFSDSPLPHLPAMPEIVE